MAKKWLSLLVAFFTVLMLNAQNTEKTIYIHPNKASCTGVAPMQCLQVRYNESAPWSILYGGIAGFDHEEGYAYTLLIREEKVDNPPADAPGIRRTLVKTISKTKMEHSMNVTGEWLIAEATNAQGEMLNLQAKNYLIQLSASSLKGKICNVFSGQYIIEDNGDVKPGFLRSTRMMCPDIATENIVMKALGNANKASLEGDTLTLMKDSTLLLRLIRKQESAGNDILSGKIFRVVEMKARDGHAQKGPEGSFMKFDLVSKQVGGKGGCNNFFGEASVKFTGSQKGEIQFSRMGSTMMACANLDEEQQLFKNLEATTHFEITGKELLLKKGEDILVKCSAD